MEVVLLPAVMISKGGKVSLADHLGGKLDNFILEEFSGRITYSTFLTIIIMSNIRKFPITNILMVNFVYHNGQF